METRQHRLIGVRKEAEERAGMQAPAPAPCKHPRAPGAPTGRPGSSVCSWAKRSACALQNFHAAGRELTGRTDGGLAASAAAEVAA